MCVFKCVLFNLIYRYVSSRAHFYILFIIYTQSGTKNEKKKRALIMYSMGVDRINVWCFIYKSNFSWKESAT
jgi:hypothetical protein